MLEKEKNIKVLIQQFSLNELQNLSKYSKQLATFSQNICQEIDQEIQKQMPDIWQKCVATGRPINNGNPELALLAKTFLLEVQTKLWHQLGFHLPRLTEQLIQEYHNSIQQQI